MEKEILLSFAKFVLPKDILESFEITGMEYGESKTYDEPELHIHLDEAMSAESLNLHIHRSFWRCLSKNKWSHGAIP